MTKRDEQDHKRAMNDKYRFVRHVYDATRFAFLLGRNRAISGLKLQTGKHVLEIGCGTGRNLQVMAKRNPGTHLYGIDISEEMLKTSRRKLSPYTNIRLSPADASTFSGDELFGRGRFDGILMSFSLSMMPQWQFALDQALSHLAPGGIISIVDFGEFGGFGPLKKIAVEGLTACQAPPIPDMWEQIYLRTFDRNGEFYPSIRQSYLGFIQLATISRNGLITSHRHKLPA